jgi:Tfp pilus assembly protein PilX
MMHTHKFARLLRQRGAVLFIALIVLVAMTLASIALIRSVDTATLGAGNLAFKQSAVQASERALAMASGFVDSSAAPQGFLVTGSNGNTDNNAHNYRASIQPADDFGVPTILASRAAFDAVYGGTNFFKAATGEELRFLVDRLCTQPGAYSDDYCAMTFRPPPGGDEAARNLVAPIPQFRVTVRADGPRNTVLFLQTVITP